MYVLTIFAIPDWGFVNVTLFLPYKCPFCWDVWLESTTTGVYLSIALVPQFYEKIYFNHFMILYKIAYSFISSANQKANA